MLAPYNVAAPSYMGSSRFRQHHLYTCVYVTGVGSKVYHRRLNAIR